MRVLVIAVGKLKERGARELADDYVRRIGRYARFEEVELKDGEPAEVAARITKAIPGRMRVVAMEVEGKPWSSGELSEYLVRAEGSGDNGVAFLIGGAYGLPKEVSDAAHVKLSLSKMTLPHRLARILLLEQIYRGFTIARGEPYSH